MDPPAQAYGPPIIQLANVTKDYGRKKIGPVDLEVRRGEIVGFLGPNGSGKTTCIRLVLGLIRPSSGRVMVNGNNPVSKHVRALKGVAYSPELPNIQTFLSPYELLRLVLHELGFQNDRDAEIKRVLELVGLLEYRDMKVGKLSKGMVQRLSVAQALVGAPQTLILDEPMLGLDPAGAAHLRNVFGNFVKKDGGTVFLSSHMMTEVESLCSSIAIIHSGKVLFRGPADEAVRKILDYSVVSIEAHGLEQSTIEKIRGMPGIAQVSTSGDLLEIVVKGPDDLRPALSDIIVHSGAKLFTVKTADNMLERAYIEALRRDGGGVAGG